MQPGMRESGIEVIGPVPWGTHFCLFYKTKQDLIDVLVPYFEAGLRNGEFCMWVTSEPFNDAEVKARLSEALPDFEAYAGRGQIEIIPYDRWYVIDGRFDSRRVLNGWVEKLRDALARGFSGMRLTGNTFWLEKAGWRDFLDYEEDVNNTIGQYSMMALCTYSLDRCDASDILDVVGTHQFALTRREGEWKIIESQEQKEMRKALRESEVRFRSLIQNSSDIIRILDRDGRIVFDSPSSARILGYPPGSMLGKSPMASIHPDDRQLVKDCLDEVYRGTNAGAPTEFRIRKADGEYLDVESIGMNMMGVPGVDGVVITTRPITERKRAGIERERLLVELKEKTSRLQDVNEEIGVKNEELAAQAEELECTNEELRTHNEELQSVTRSLCEAQDYLESLITYANAPIIVWDPRFTITRFNQAFERLSGYTAAEIIGKDLSILFPPDSREESLDRIKKTLEGEHWESVEIPILHKYGSVRIALWNSANIYDEKNNLLATIAQGQDITARKQAEKDLGEAKAQAELYLDLMGHDISNLHQIIGMQLEMAADIMKTEGKPDGEDRALIDSSIRVLEKATRLINNVRKLQMLRSGEYETETIDLAVTLQDTLKMYASIPGREITTRYVPVSGIFVRANPLLKDVFINLIDNAVKHSAGPLEIGIDVHRVGLNGSAYYRVAIEDNGNGIPDEKKDEVFQRFTRGQTKAKGTGLGLYLVRSLVEGFGGYVEVQNRVLGDYTKGTRFLVYLPPAGDEMP